MSEKPQYEAKVVKVVPGLESTAVTVGFYSTKVEEDGEQKLLLDKVYYMGPKNTIDDIKPEIKRDLESFIATQAQGQNLEELKNKTIDLAGVNTPEEQKKIDAEKAGKGKPVEASNVA